MSDICEQCGMLMVYDDRYDPPVFCESWLEMEGGCPPAPRFVDIGKESDEKVTPTNI